MLLKRMTPKIFCHQSTLLHRFTSLSKIQKNTLLLGQNDSLFKLKVNKQTNFETNVQNSPLSHIWQRAYPADMA